MTTTKPSFLSTRQQRVAISAAVMAELEQKLAIARLAAEKATAIICKELTSKSDLQLKSKAGDYDLVTQIDYKSDAVIREVLEKHCPKDILLTEETYPEGTGAPIVLHESWVVDPVDGTTNLAHGLPHFAISIAYCLEGQPVLGLVVQPLLNDSYSAIIGQGAFLNNAALQVSDAKQLNDSLLATGFPKDEAIGPHENMPAFLHFMENCHGVRRLGSAALDLVYIARGSLDALWEMRLAPWDVAAGLLLVQEAGGHISDFQGLPLSIERRKINILASNGQASLHEAVQQGLSQKLHPSLIEVK